MGKYLKSGFPFRTAAGGDMNMMKTWFKLLRLVTLLGLIAFNTSGLAQECEWYRAALPSASVEHKDK